MFAPDFYPTDNPTIDTMFEGETIAGKVAYDPQGGKGNIVDRLKLAGASQVLASEKHPDLRKILQTKCKVIGDDFFKIESHQISHVDIIVMNPPFSNAAAHIIHAFNIAPPGCRIVSLCNAETLKNTYTKTREELRTIVDTHGNYIELGDVFANAERKTDVNTALIRIEKPAANYSQEFEGFFIDEDPEEKTGPGLMPYNIIRDLVNRYVESVKIFDQQLETAVRLNELQAGYFDSNLTELSISITRLTVPVKRNDFKKQMQKQGWSFIFDKLNMHKYSTKGLKEDLNKFVETQEQIPFTMRNIYKMLEVVVGTQGSRMDKAILEVFEKITKHYSENRHNLEGWKTNSHYILNRRFIMPHVVEINYGGKMRANYSGWAEPIEDMQKAVCHLTGKNYDEMQSLHDFLYKTDKDFGTWHEWGFFKIKGFKKGTMHFEFLDEKVWGLFNQRVAKLNGYPLPEQKAQTAWQKKQTGYQDVKPAATKAPQKPVILKTIKINKAA